MFLLKLVLLLFGCVLCFVRSFLYFSFCLHQKNKHNNASEDKEHQPHSSIDDNNKKHDNTSKDTERQPHPTDDDTDTISTIQKKAQNITHIVEGTLTT